MNLVVDFGNSSAKAGCFEGETIAEVHADLSLNDVSTIIREKQPAHILVSSVSVPEAEIKEILGEEVIIFNHLTPLPFHNAYNSPETLGRDRLAGVAGAQVLFPGSHCLVIDMGTCITYDLITNKGDYLGGGISPGVYLRFKAIHTFTARLPMVEFKADAPLIGATTNESIQSGVIHGIQSELEGIISRYQGDFTPLNIIICGGDSKYFENTLKQPIFAAPEIVLRGLNRILTYNA